MPTKMYLPPKGESRRGVLKKGIFGGLLLAAGGAAWVALRPGKHEPEPAGGRVALSPREYAALAAVARRLLPRGGTWPAPETVGVAQACDKVIARLDEISRVELRQLLNLLESGLSGLLSAVSAQPFTLMGPEDQDAVLEGWRKSRLMLKRSGFHALRSLAVGVYFADPTVWPAMGYPGPPPIRDAGAVPWRGGGEPRPPGLGVWTEPER